MNRFRFRGEFLSGWNMKIRRITYPSVALNRLLEGNLGSCGTGHHAGGVRGLHCTNSRYHFHTKSHKSQLSSIFRNYHFLPAFLQRMHWTSHASTLRSHTVLRKTRKLPHFSWRCSRATLSFPLDVASCSDHGLRRRTNDGCRAAGGEL